VTQTGTISWDIGSFTLTAYQPKREYSQRIEQNTLIRICVDFANLLIFTFPIICDHLQSSGNDGDAGGHSVSRTDRNHNLLCGGRGARTIYQMAFFPAGALGAQVLSAGT
jgi:hypothetical protein